MGCRRVAAQANLNLESTVREVGVIDTGTVAHQTDTQVLANRAAIATRCDVTNDFPVPVNRLASNENGFGIIHAEGHEALLKLLSAPLFEDGPPEASFEMTGYASDLLPVLDL